MGQRARYISERIGECPGVPANIQEKNKNKKDGKQNYSLNKSGVIPNVMGFSKKKILFFFYVLSFFSLSFSPIPLPLTSIPMYITVCNTYSNYHRSYLYKPSNVWRNSLNSSHLCFVFSCCYRVLFDFLLTFVSSSIINESI